MRAKLKKKKRLNGAEILDRLLFVCFVFVSEHCDSSITCNNGGFVDQNCKCICPDGTDSCTKNNVEPDGKELAFLVEVLCYRGLQCYNDQIAFAALCVIVDR